MRASNIQIFKGRFTKDPEIRMDKNRVKHVYFTLAESKQDPPNYVDFDARDDKAEQIVKYFRKGKEILVTATQETYKVEDRGEMRRRTLNKVEAWTFCGSDKQEPFKEEKKEQITFNDVLPEELPFY